MLKKFSEFGKLYEFVDPNPSVLINDFERKISKIINSYLVILEESKNYVYLRDICESKLNELNTIKIQIQKFGSEFSSTDNVKKLIDKIDNLSASFKESSKSWDNLADNTNFIRKFK
jgi:hypothetical protein